MLERKREFNTEKAKRAEQFKRDPSKGINMSLSEITGGGIVGNVLVPAVAGLITACRAVDERITGSGVTPDSPVYANVKRRLAELDSS